MSFKVRILVLKSLKSLKYERKEFAKEIANINKNRAVLNKKKDVASKEATKAKENLKKALATHKASNGGMDYTKPVRELCEEILVQHVIERPAYHGGEFVGNMCRLLMEKAQVVMGALKDTLTEYMIGKKNAKTIEEVGKYCDEIGASLKLFDSLLSILRKTEVECNGGSVV